MIRIIGGNSKGRRIAFKKTFSKKDSIPLRPTSAKVRKAIFDIIGDRIKNASFLDLYAGSGAVGIEALSRGAYSVVFVDESVSRVKAIKEIIASLGLDSKTEVIRCSVKSFISNLKRKDKISFQIVFIDPPYDSNELEEIMPLLDKKDMILDGGLVIVEHSSKKVNMPSEIGKLKLVKQYKYGDTTLSLYIKKSLK